MSFAIDCISTSFIAKAQTFFSITQILSIAVFIGIGKQNVSYGKIENYKIVITNNKNKSMEFNSLSLAFVSARFSCEGWGETAALNAVVYRQGMQSIQ